MEEYYYIASKLILFVFCGISAVIFIRGVEGRDFTLTISGAICWAFFCLYAVILGLQS